MSRENEDDPPPFEFGDVWPDDKSFPLRTCLSRATERVRGLASG
jgi:hypothetical protein